MPSSVFFPSATSFFICSSYWLRMLCPALDCAKTPCVSTTRMTAGPAASAGAADIPNASAATTARRFTADVKLIRVFLFETLIFSCLSGVSERCTSAEAEGFCLIVIFLHNDMREVEANGSEGRLPVNAQADRRARLEIIHDASKNCLVIITKADEATIRKDGG